MAAKPRAKPDTSWFQHDRFGMFIHWGTYALAARHEWVKHNERMDTATYNKKLKRLYVHVLAWPFRDIHLPKMAGKVEYAQLLHDASEIRFSESSSKDPHGHMQGRVPPGALTLKLPIVQPKIEIPVIELFLA